MTKNIYIKLILCSIFFFLITVKTNGQCYIQKKALNNCFAYTSKSELIYKRNDGQLEISTIVDKLVTSDNNYNFNLIFTISGHVSYFFVPNIAEITTLSGKVLSFYIPNVSNAHDAGYLMYCECYGNFNKNNQNINTLMIEGIKKIVLKRDEKSISIKTNSNIYTNIFQCLKIESE